MDPRTIGILAALGSAVAWSVGLVLLKRIRAEVPAPGMTIVTGALGAGLMGGWLLAAGGAGELAPDVLALLVVSGLLGIALGDTFFFESLGGLGAHLVVLFAILGQAVTLLLAVLLLGERLGPIELGGVALIVAGVATAMFEPGGGRSTRRGIAFGLLSTLCVSASVLVAKRALEVAAPAQATFVRMAVGALGVVLIGAARGRLGAWLGPLRDPAALRQVLAVTFVATFGGFHLYHLALAHIDVALANPLAATEPLFTLPLAAIFLGERPRRRAVVGALLAVGGVAVVGTAP